MHNCTHPILNVAISSSTAIYFSRLIVSANDTCRNTYNNNLNVPRSNVGMLSKVIRLTKQDRYLL